MALHLLCKDEHCWAKQQSEFSEKNPWSKIAEINKYWLAILYQLSHLRLGLENNYFGELHSDFTDPNVIRGLYDTRLACILLLSGGSPWGDNFSVMTYTEQ